MKTLALNCGSSTVKFQLFEIGGSDHVLARGLVDRIGGSDAEVTIESPGSARRCSGKAIADHREAMRAVMDSLATPEHGVLEDLGEIDGVGHRVVHAGEYYSDSVLIDDEVERRIEDCNDLAPLHNPHNLTGYRAARRALPWCPMVAVFDTAFHQSIPKRAFLYGLPYRYYTDHHIRRYGFHGTSHRYVCERFAEINGSSSDVFRLVTCHLGNGASMCAVDRGRSVDTSLGFTPLEGLLMGTRTGDLDPAIPLFLMQKHGLSVEEVDDLLNRQSGLLGLSGLTNDMRALIDAYGEGHEGARLALDVFCYRIKRYIGAFYGVLNGADALIFTGGIGEHQPPVRRLACEGLGALGITLDQAKNESAIGVEAKISPDGSETAVWVIPTNEELLIARETVRCIRAAS